MTNSYAKLLFISFLTPFLLICPGFSQAPPYTVSGSVYIDHDNNSLFDGLDYGHPGIRVQVFEDVNGNGVFESGETLLGESITIVNGDYTVTGINPGGVEFTIAIDPDDLAAGYTISNGPLTLPVGDYADQALSFQGENVVCYTVSDADIPDRLVVVNRKSGTHTYIGSNLGFGIDDVEAISFDIGAGTLYAIDADQLGTIDISTGSFTALPNPLGAALHSTLGTLLVDDADGMCFDPFSGDLYATARISGAPDALIKIDVVTGSLIPDAFGAGNDYLPLTGAGLNFDIDDIGISPVTGIMYGINNDNGANDVLVEINRQTGIMTALGPITDGAGNPLKDVEGFGFTNSGILVATTGDLGTPPLNDAAFTIDLATQQATLITMFSIGGAGGTDGDYEACDCLTQRENTLSGTVFFDDDANGLQNGVEAGAANVKVYIYIDTNGDGIVNAGDVKVDSLLTDAFGNYSWETASNLNFAITLDPATFPPLFGYTASTEEQAPFGGGFGGQTDPNNNFGLASVTSFPVELVDLSVVQSGMAAKLQWLTASEINSDYFSVERSLDPVSFSAPLILGRVEAAGFSAQNQYYSFVDKDVALQGVSRAYYRLRTVDLDGTYAYSNIVALNVDRNAGLQAWISPNPTSGSVARVEFVADRPGSLEYQVLSASGQVVARQHLPHLNSTSGRFEIPTHHLAPGLYLVEISNGYQTQLYKLSIR